MAKLTLSIDDRVISSAKRYAKERGVSLSELVENYLAAVSAPPSAAELPPITRSLKGVLKSVDVKLYRRHLTTKYS